MTSKRFLGTGAEIAAMTNRLGSFEKITRFDDHEHKECGALAYGLGHIEDSCHRILNDWLPQLTANDASEEQIFEALDELALQIKHLLWHAKDSRYIEGYLF